MAIRYATWAPGQNFQQAARFIAFEGDVRVIRAATRETITPGSDTELYPGDTVQTLASGRARQHGRRFHARRSS